MPKTAKPAEPKMLTVADVAAMCGVSTRTVVRWADSDILPVAMRTVGGHRRFAPDTVRSFIRQQQGTGD